MKMLIIDVIGLVGFSLLAAGLYLQFGLPCVLMFFGVGLLAWALLVAMRSKYVT